MDFGEGAPFLLLFGDLDVVGTLGSDLPEVGDAKDLLVGGECLQRGGDVGGGLAADVGVDLVEDEGTGLLLVCEEELKSEEDPGHLPSAGAGIERLTRLA